LLIFLHGEGRKMKSLSVLGKSQSGSENYPTSISVVGIARKSSLVIAVTSLWISVKKWGTGEH